MSKERSAGAVVIHKGKQIEYLLLLHLGLTKNKKHWDFPKGHIEKNETEDETIIREVKEETDLSDIKLYPAFRESVRYFFQKDGKTIFKTVIFRLAESKTKSVKISSEHIDYIWLPYEQAMDALTYISAKRVLKGAKQYINRNID
jgi:8-oxo-dGTP pyrophosphatase MutT (NUDIX family)